MGMSCEVLRVQSTKLSLDMLNISENLIATCNGKKNQAAGSIQERGISFPPPPLLLLTFFKYIESHLPVLPSTLSTRSSFSRCQSRLITHSPHQITSPTTTIHLSTQDPTPCLTSTMSRVPTPTLRKRPSRGTWKSTLAPSAPSISGTTIVALLTCARVTAWIFPGSAASVPRDSRTNVSITLT